MEINNDKKIVKLEELLPFTDDEFTQYEEQRFDELIEEIRVNSEKHSIFIRDNPYENTNGKYQVLAGHNIVRAAEKAGLDSVLADMETTQEEINHDFSQNSAKEELSFGAYKNFRRIRQNDDAIMIELDKLVPYDNCTFELFKGKRLEEMIDNIRVLGVVQPIIVRPTINGNYEILNGHYRVAAVMRLELDTVPAVVREGLADEEARLYVSETDPIGLLTKYDIDIEASDYKDTKSYKRIQNARIFSDDNFSMSLDEYIERYLLTKDEASNAYDSKYDMGNPYELSDDECQYPKLIAEIDRITAMYVLSENKYVTVGTFTQSGGYIEQLKSHLNLDFDSFDSNDIRNKREKIKILYFLYMLKNRYFPQINVLEMLGKPSMENIDNSFVGRETSNGRFIKVIKHSLEKELTLQAKDNIKGALDHVADTWGSFLINIPMKTSCLSMYGYEYDFDGAIKSLLSQQTGQSERKGVEYFPLSPIETMYLKILQHEYLGQVKDILKILDLQEGSEYSVPPEFIKKMKKYHAKKININNIEAFFSVNNVQKIAKYIFLKSITSKEERRKIRNSKDKMLKFLDFCYLSELVVSEDEKVSELLIISCLQAIMLDDQNEIFDYVFHGYGGKQGNRKGKIYVQAALKNDGRTYDALQLYWVRKVVDRWYANVGRYDMRRKLRELEKVCFRILDEILSCSTIDEMLRLNDFYPSKLT